VIADGARFIDMIEARNLLSRTYDFATFHEIFLKIAGEYLPALRQFHRFLSEQAS
jgi:hypothetical protein